MAGEEKSREKVEQKNSESRRVQILYSLGVTSAFTLIKIRSPL